MGLYLHVPFCIRKCNYCDFLSFDGIPDGEQKAYFRALAQEIKIYGNIYGNKYYVDTIFIGGGTPSMVTEEWIAEMMAAVRDSFDIDENAEISMESNPKTLSKRKLEAYLGAGVNRLSIGAQSLDNRLLRYMSRVHDRGDFLLNYALARECGFQNINIDLMFGIPGQTMDVWTDTLTQIVGLGPEHISFYSLQLEEGTPFYTMLEQGSLIKIDDESDRNMYHEALKILEENGYRQYEISNAARDGYQCRHNLKYWSMEDYLGIGLGAHSFLNGTRSSNETALDLYIKAGMLNDETFHSVPAQTHCSPFTVWRHANSVKDNLSEFMFTGLRKTEGIDLRGFTERFGKPVEEIFSAGWHRIQRYIDEGYLIRSEDCLRFSRKGIDISNTILIEFL